LPAAQNLRERFTIPKHFYSGIIGLLAVMSFLASDADFRTRTVVVTGASAGVGRATVHRFARAGAQIGLIARDQGALEDVKTEVERLGGEALVAPADVADANAVFAAADRIVREFGAIDVWVNDAMLTVFSPLMQMTPEEFRRVTEVTYLGYVHGTMAALRHMQPRDRGTIVQVGSTLAYRGIPLQSAYCGAKHAIRGFTDSLRCELIHAGSNIALTMVHLPAVNTPQFDWARTHLARAPRPVGDVVQPEVIAEAIFHAALRPRREVWIGWNTVTAILGNMLVPQFIDRYLARIAIPGQQTRQPVLPGRRDNLMEPVHGLHRTRGSFDEGARDSAVAVPGPAARLAPVIAGALALFGMGMLVGRAGAQRNATRRTGW
jgi:NAD(P)-dependent dehydrogenase (short-subunit alcohol dehydrogenase family)